MTEKRGLPHIQVPLITKQGLMTPEWYMFFEELNKKAATQDDASTVSDPPTQAEVNALVAIINALIDKLQDAGVME